MISININISKRRLANDLRSYIQRKNKLSTSSYNPNDTWITEFACYDSFLKLKKLIIFYEFSNLYSTPKKFTNVKDLYDFLKASHIRYPDYYMREAIKKNDIIYMCCKKGLPELICKTSYKSLQAEV